MHTEWDCGTKHIRKDHPRRKGATLCSLGEIVDTESSNDKPKIRDGQAEKKILLCYSSNQKSTIDECLLYFK